MKAARAKGNAREDHVARLFADRGRHAVVLRGSGSRGTVQQKSPLRVAGDVIVLPSLEMLRDPFELEKPTVVQHGPGIQIEVGGAGKRFAAEFADLRDSSVPGYALVVSIFAGMKPSRWLLGDDDGGWTECADLDDLLATIEVRA